MARRRCSTGPWRNSCQARGARAFGVFYTLTIGAGALSPSLYGLLGDAIGVPRTIVVIAAVVLLVMPLTLWLRPALRATRAV